MIVTPEYKCWLNILAVLEWYGVRIGMPDVMKRDRVFVTGYLINRFPKEFHKWELGIGGHGSTAVAGLREFVPMYSMQVIQHRHVGPDVTTHWIELDFDMFNPDYGAGPALCHLGEVLWHKIKGGKTDPFKVAEGLRKRGIML